MNLISTEVDGSPEEIEGSLDTLQTLGFRENKLISEVKYFPGKRTWIGSVMVFTKNLKLLSRSPPHTYDSF